PLWIHRRSDPRMGGRGRPAAERSHPRRRRDRLAAREHPPAVESEVPGVPFGSGAVLPTLAAAGAGQVRTGERRPRNHRRGYRFALRPTGSVLVWTRSHPHSPDRALRGLAPDPRRSSAVGPGDFENRGRHAAPVAAGTPLALRPRAAHAANGRGATIG